MSRININPPNKSRLWTPTFVLLIACTFFAFMVGQGSNAGTSVYLEKTGSSTVLAGLGALIFSFGAAISRIFSGYYIDSHGRKIVMCIGAALLLLGSVGPLFGNTGALFVVWRAFQGIGFSALTTATATAAADVLPLPRLGEGIGYYGLGQAVSMSIGPALALFLISTNPPENFYFGLTACATLALICCLLCRYEKHPEILPEDCEYRKRIDLDDVPYFHGETVPDNRVGETDASLSKASDAVSPANTDATFPTSTDSSTRPKFQSAWHRIIDRIFEPAALPATIVMALMSTAFGFGIFYMGVYGSWLGFSTVGLFYTVSAVSMIAVRLTSGKFMDKAKPINIMGVAALAGVICYFMMLACTTVDVGLPCEILFYSAGIPYGISLGLSIPINQAVAVKQSPPDRWGTANGLFFLGNDIAIGLASAAFGITNQFLGFSTTMAIVIVMIAASMVLAKLLYPKDQPQNH